MSHQDPTQHTVPACELVDVTVTYGGVTAVDGVSLRVRRGETVALVGSSGAGKTSVLRVLAGQVRPALGEAYLQGRPVARHGRGLHRTVGMMQQRLDLVGQLSARHNVQAGALGRWGVLRSLAALVLPVEHPPARQAAHRAGIADKLGVRVSDLSGGEQQRVALARLLVQDPGVMLADEPVAALDPARAEDLVSLLCCLAREEGRTLVASLHNPGLARTHFDRMVGLAVGRVVFDLPVDEVTDAMFETLYDLRVGNGQVDDGGAAVATAADDAAPAPAPSGPRGAAARHARHDGR